MNSTIKYVLAFLGGTATGVAVSWNVLKTKYKQIAEEEIQSVKDMYSKRDKELIDKIDDILEPENEKFSDEEIEEYKSVTSIYGESSIGTEKPYVISPDEFGELDGYETITLYYYTDEVLMDDNNEPVEDVDDIVGYDSLLTFGQYEDDSVFVRNDKLKCDYEILMSMRKSYEVSKSTDVEE